MSNRRSIPNLPADTPKSLRPLLQSLREAMQVLDNSKRGNKLDAAVTFRDLEKLKLSAGTSISISGGGSSGSPSTPVDNGPVEFPTIPTGVEVVAGFDFALARWDYPTYNGHAFTEVWRLSIDENDSEQLIEFDAAILVGAVDGMVLADNIPEQSKHVYWIRHVNVNDEYGPVHSIDGTEVNTALRYDQLIDSAREAVLAALEIWQSDFGTALSILDNDVLKLILENSTTIGTLTNRVQAVETNAAAYYNQTVTAVASQVGSAVTKVDRIQASVYQTDGNGTVLLDEDGNPVLASSFIDRVDAVMASTDGALLAAIGATLSVDDGEGIAYSLSEILSVAKDVDGRFSSQWGVKQSVGELQYGVGFVSYTEADGKVRTAFHVAAETFSIFDPAKGTEIIPFIVKDNRVFIKDALIDIASITTLIAGTIITGELFAGKKIVSPIIEGGSIKGSSVNVNDKFTVNSAGVMRAHGAFIYDNNGNVILSSIGIDGTYIKDLTVDTLKIKENAVTVQSFSETAPINIEKRGTGYLYSTAHPHDGQHSSGSVLVNILVEAIRTTGGSPSDQIYLYADVYDGDSSAVIQSHPQITVGWPENANTSFFTPILMFIPRVTNESIRVRLMVVSSGEAHTVSMRVVVSSAKR